MFYSISLPECKSIVIRQLLVYYGAHGEVLPIASDACNDVRVTHRALRSVKQEYGRGCTVDVEDCGAACRFLMALMAVTPGNWLLTGSPRMLKRPAEELVDALASIGAVISRNADGWEIKGRKLHTESLAVDCTRSSQFASALLLIAPQIGLRKLCVEGKSIPSIPYIQLTRMCIPTMVEIPELPFPNGDLGRLGDWSAAAFWYAQALLHPEHVYELRNLSLHSAQGDSILAEWMDVFGVESVETYQGVRVKHKSTENLKSPVRLDVADHLDLVPVLAAMACVCQLDVTFSHVRNLAYKESDRIQALVEQLSPFAEILETGEDDLHVVGCERKQWPLAPYRFSSYHDHRLAMAFLLFGGDARLDDVDCLRKSYPQLLEILSL